MHCKKCRKRVPSGSTHGQRIRCTTCNTEMRFCEDCRMLLVNFRRHRKRGHQLYIVQRDKHLYEACRILLSLHKTTTTIQ
jgi:hypothetical protein